jgi:carbon-monoxide dehydrogenase small subunit
VDGFPALSCSVLAATMDGHEITTVEGIADEMEDYMKALAEEGADQCGYCSPGMMVMVYALKKEIENNKVRKDKEAIRRYLIGNLCRCSGYLGQERAIFKFLGVK